MYKIPLSFLKKINSELSYIEKNLSNRMSERQRTQIKRKAKRLKEQINGIIGE